MYTHFLSSIQKITQRYLHFERHLGRIARRSHLRWVQPSLYPVGLGLLLLSTLQWSLYSAAIRAYNADQIVDSMLLSNWASFHGATFPGAHTLLLKWPLIAGLAQAGVNQTMLTVGTVLFAMMTVGSLAWILAKIIRVRPVLGLLYIALSSVLLLVPAEPSDGALLPLNMAMITTRNLEYIVLIGWLYCAAKAHGITKLRGNHWLWAAILTGSLLVVSDRLFGALVLAGGAMGYIVYRWLWPSRVMAAMMLRLFSTGMAALAISWVAVIAITASGLTSIDTSTGNNPYPINLQPTHLAKGAYFAVHGTLSNFGANPFYGAYDVAAAKAAAAKILTSKSSIVYAINAGLLAFGLICAHRVTSGLRRKRALTRFDLWPATGVMLLWMTLAAYVVFVATDHYFVADGRYLTISLFAITLLTASRLRAFVSLPPGRYIVVGGILLASALSASAIAYHQHTAALDHYQPVAASVAVAQDALAKNNTAVLLGDYWHTIPMALSDTGALAASPTVNCETPTKVLSSAAWQPSLGANIAYLRAPTDPCTADQINLRYGTPVKSVRLADGDQLLIYRRSKPAKHIEAVQPSPPKPICTTHLTNIVAHADDDLLFINPAITDALKAGVCVHTVYLTAGQANGDSAYWHARETGALAAYEDMLGGTTWQPYDRYYNNHLVSGFRSEPEGRAQLSFLRLSDGNVNGHGFENYHYQSLAHIWKDPEATMVTVDTDQAYNKDDLVGTLAAILQFDKPTVVNTLDFDHQTGDGDHSDHHHTGYFAQAAFESAKLPTPSTLVPYYGYPIARREANIASEDRDAKQRAFFAYASHDGAVCDSMEDCIQRYPHTYASYLERQYSGTAITKQ